ncbi:MAG: glutathione peroxidase [Myxococcales bacterium]|nr:glutathione peroxidase [Myxococcales bacterium]
MAKKTLTYATPVETLRGQTTDLTDYQGKVLLIVNTASKCGLTPQYKGLEKLQQDLGERGLQVLGFPCNQFGGQEPGSADDIEAFCQLNYGVSFPMHSKVEVNGSGTHPLFKELKSAAPGLLGSKAIKWNFTKFLVARDGTIIRRYGPKTTPAELAPDLERML